MSQIAYEYTIGEISHQLGGQIPWGTLIEITTNLNFMKKCYSILKKAK